MMKSILPEIKIMLVDDHKLIVQAYESSLKDIRHLTIIGKAYNGVEALELIRRNPPDVVILDADMPVMNGYETLKAIREYYRDMKVIILTMHKQAVFMSNFLVAGANAFLAKNCELDELVKAIYSVYDEGYYFSTTASKALTKNDFSNEAYREMNRQLRLTEREISIMLLVCEEESNEAIAQKLNVTANTIKFFRKNIYKKTNANTALGLIKYAIRNGIISVDS